MNRIISVFSVAILTLLSSPAFAIRAVPEIDGSNAGIAIGLTLAAIALVKEYRRNK